MQHPDEGTIHSWLDGELGHEEAAEMESHIAACSSCAAAVAEARGFVAASSRILTALDDVPRGVIPAAPRQTRDLRVIWRAAAAMLVVAGGSLVVMREGGQDATVSRAATESVTASAPASSAPIAAEGTVDGTASTDATRSTADRATAGQVDENAASKRPATPSAPQVGRGAAFNERDLTLRAERRSRQDAKEATSAGIGASSVPMTAPLAPQSSGAPPSSEAGPLKVLSVERSIGSRRTTYEIAPSQTVVLTEFLSLQLSAVVTSAASEAQRQAPANARAVEPRRLEAAPPTAPPVMRDSRSAADSTKAANQTEAVAKASVGQIQAGAAFAAAVHTISWTDASTGNRLTLSGKMPVERLQEIRQRIERERAAATKP